MSYKRKLEKGLSPTQKQTLRDQTIAARSPGPILHDVEAMLQYVQENEVVLSTTGLLPLKALGPLNEAMLQPLQIGLTRPQLRSVPNIEGLFMLLRATGLVRIEHRGKKQLLRLDSEAAAVWERLNDVERYFSLLHTWFIRADLEVVRKRSSYSGPLIADCLDFVLGLRSRFRQSPDRVIYLLQYQPGLYNVALAEMFGLVAIRQQPARKGQGWSIDSIKPTPLGEALCALIAKTLSGSLGFFLPDDETFAFQGWQEVLAPYFPELHQEFLLPEDEPVKGLHSLKVSVGNCWRLLAVPHTCTMDVLAAAVLDAFEFDHDHLYEFLVENRFGSVRHINHPYMDEPLYADETTIGELSLQPGQFMVFHYDFGDDWEFGIDVERIEPENSRMRRPKQLKAHGKAPSQYRWYDEDGEAFDDESPDGDWLPDET